MSIDEIELLRRWVREKRSNKYMAEVLNYPQKTVANLLDKHNLTRPKSKAPTQNYNFRLECGLMDGIRQQAEERGLSVNHLVGLVLRKHLNKKT